MRQNSNWIPENMNNSEFWPPSVFWMEGVPRKVTLCEQKGMYSNNVYRSRIIVHGAELTLTHKLKHNPLVMCACNMCQSKSSVTGPKLCPACSHLAKHCRILFECNDSEGISFSHLNVDPKDIKRIECINCEGGHLVKWAHLGKLECVEGVPAKRVQVSCRYEVRKMASHTCDAKLWIKGLLSFSRNQPELNLAQKLNPAGNAGICGT